MLKIEPKRPSRFAWDTETSSAFLQKFLAANSTKLIEDMANYGAVLLRGFDIGSDEQFEETILSIPDFHAISDVFMPEDGRAKYRCLFGCGCN